jgi:hypothetical protein
MQGELRDCAEAVKADQPVEIRAVVLPGMPQQNQEAGACEERAGERQRRMQPYLPRLVKGCCVDQREDQQEGRAGDDGDDRQRRGERKKKCYRRQAQQ